VELVVVRRCRGPDHVYADAAISEGEPLSANERDLPQRPPGTQPPASTGRLPEGLRIFPAHLGAASRVRARAEASSNICHNHSNCNNC